ncbi:MAG: hypothetical protein FWE15_27190, partial [Actinomycetia bacterium]|nr:hypothetical protein [Actinomycetes bacterium]
MKIKYKETARGGLVVHVIDVLTFQAVACTFPPFGSVGAFGTCMAESPSEVPPTEPKLVDCAADVLGEDLLRLHTAGGT